MIAEIELTEAEMAELKKHTNEADDAAALHAAMMEYLRYVRRMQLKELPGRIQVQDNWSELEQAELGLTP